LLKYQQNGGHEMNKRIKEAIEKLQIAKKDMYTAKELEDISKTAKCSMLDVMYYLRFKR